MNAIDNLLLANLKCVFFFRSFFENYQYVAEKISQLQGYEFSISNLLPGIVDNIYVNMPFDVQIYNLTSKDKQYKVGISKTRVDVLFEPNTEENEKINYDTVISSFANLCILISDIIIEKSFCNRIGFINNSFVPTEDADSIIKKRFFKNIENSSSELSVSYNKITEFKKCKINNFIRVSSAKIKNSVSSDNNNGISILKDINTREIHDLNNTFIKQFINKSKTTVDKKSIRGIIDA